MSYDVSVYSETKPEWREIMAGLEGWKGSENGFRFTKASWQIVVEPCVEVEEEDIPEEVFERLPGLRYLFEIHLEPIHAPDAAHTILQAIANRIANISRGVILDSQQGTISTPHSVKRIGSAKPPERISVFNLAWWFTESPLVGSGGIAEFLSILKKYLPEALPRRYGDYEPPQYKYEVEGKEHFLKFLSETTQWLVWYPNYPVVSIGFGACEGFGPRRMGYKANSLEVEIDSSVWAQPGWEQALKRFWYAMSEFIRPFFGEVCLLGNYILRRGRLFVDEKTDSHPVKNGWWNGIPRRLGPAVVIDERYAALWPAFVKKSDHRNGLFYISAENWIFGENVDRSVGGVPEGIAQGKYFEGPGDGRTTYPRIWPFEHPFAE